ncbi:MAG: 50S ribosomal protein L14e [Candidatus Bathyarchaeota archaeon]
MSALDIGQICVKKLGREAGKKCVIVDIIDQSFVLVTGPKVLTGIKRRRANIKHLEPTDGKLNLSKNASDEMVVAAVKAAGKTKEMEM